MRLSEAKIRALAGRMILELKRRDDVQWIAAPDTVEAEIARVIRDNLLEEDALDAEVETTVERYRREIATQHLDAGLLRQKIKKQLAKDRGIVL
jgi:hypothetical protein